MDDFLVVSRSNLSDVIAALAICDVIALDLETTGLFPYHGDRLFSMALSDGSKSYYFNFQKYEGVPEEFILPIEALLEISQLFQYSDITWAIHNAKFDLAFLQVEGFTIDGIIHCTQSMTRLEDNNQRDMSLEDCAKRIGLTKLDEARQYLDDNNLKKKKLINDNIFTGPDYTKLPFELAARYACQDAYVCYKICESQLSKFRKWKQEAPRVPAVLDVCMNESRLTKTLARMETRGALINRHYCEKSLALCKEKMEHAVASFSALTGKDFKMSNKLFQEVFQTDKPSWEYTEKHNPSFVTDIIEKFSNEAAEHVITYRTLKNKLDFFSTFLKYRDENDVIHTNFDPARAVTGRFSSSKPNLQNLKRPDQDEPMESDLDVRSAFIPRPGYVFVLIDFDAVEFKLMLDLADARSLIREVKNGLDVHTATAKLAGVTRQEAKMCNFLTIYSGGIKLLAEKLNTTEEKARAIQQAIFKAAPEMKTFIRSVIEKAETRGWVFNWFGRRYFFPEKDKCYRASNYLIQGGSSDIIKICMNRIDELLLGTRSHMILTIHDELVFEIHESEYDLVPRIKEIMETAYPHKHLPLTVSVEHSFENLTKKQEGFPQARSMVQSECGAEKSRNEIQGQDQASFEFAPQHVVREDSAGNAKGHS